jgi:hypothetical protein
VLGGGFGLWLGDNIAILSMVMLTPRFVLQTGGLRANLLHQAGVQEFDSRHSFHESEVGSHRVQMQDGLVIWSRFRVGF